MSKSTYDNIASIYDQVMGQEHLERYVEILKSATSSHTGDKKARVLDIGCGTGTLLSLLPSSIDTTGIDSSSAMIEIAKQKNSDIDYKVQDITHFSLNQSFDYIVCTFDTINHLDTLDKWEMVFKKVAEHLTKGGVFLFDFNTLKKFERIDNKNLIQKFDDNFFILRTFRLSEKQSRWMIDAFVQSQNHKDLYKHLSTEVVQTTFPLDSVLSSLEKYFSEVNIIEKTEGEGRVFIQAKK